LQDICNQDVLIYRYFPDGSKNIQDCKPFNNKITSLNKIECFNSMYVFCHDQEPIDLSFFPKLSASELPNIPFNVYRWWANNWINRYDKIILVHSEQNSKEVLWFQNNGSIPVYWWSHAVIAIDWFRYAKVDPTLQNISTKKQDFLIYNRAWQGTREYRLKFAEMLVSNGLNDHCRMRFNPVDGCHYSDHQFQNSLLKISNIKLEEYYQLNESHSDASADYCALDYLETQIEVVLETLFDDQRLHLTEKTIRPIACGHPFIIVGPMGSLKYLKQYGFKTFDSLIDESYDTIVDPVARLQSIVSLMKSIHNLNNQEKQNLYQKMKVIAEYNKTRFFSDEFFSCVVEEFTQNFNHAAEQMKQHQTGAYFNLLMKKYPDLSMFGGVSASEMDQINKIFQSNSKTCD